MISTPKISIITPCYNGGRYIIRCAESVRHQIEQNYEWIIIDDGSKDGSYELLDELAASDSRIIVRHTQNGGVSEARNLGLQLAQAPWITFLDIDDTLPKEALSTLLKVGEVNEAISFVMAGYSKIIDGKRSENPALRHCILSAEATAKELFEPSDYPYQGYICSKLYKREIIKKFNIRFKPEIKYNEDRLFTFNYLSHSSECGYITDSVYVYHINEAGAMESVNGPDFWKFETDLDAFLEMTKISKVFASKSLTNLVLRGVYRSYKRNRNLNYLYGNDNKETNKRLRQKLRSVVNLSHQINFKRDELWKKNKIRLIGWARRLKGQ